MITGRLVQQIMGSRHRQTGGATDLSSSITVIRPANEQASESVQVSQGTIQGGVPVRHPHGRHSRREMWRRLRLHRRCDWIRIARLRSSQCPLVENHQ